MIIRIYHLTVFPVSFTEMTGLIFVFEPDATSSSDRARDGVSRCTEAACTTAPAINCFMSSCSLMLLIIDFSAVCIASGLASCAALKIAASSITTGDVSFCEICATMSSAILSAIAALHLQSTIFQCQLNSAVADKSLRHFCFNSITCIDIRLDGCPYLIQTRRWRHRRHSAFFFQRIHTDGVLCHLLGDFALSMIDNCLGGSLQDVLPVNNRPHNLGQCPVSCNVPSGRTAGSLAGMDVSTSVNEGLWDASNARRHCATPASEPRWLFPCFPPKRLMSLVN